MQFTPKELMEIRGAKIYMWVIITMLVLASITQYLGGSAIAIILPTTVGYGFCAAIAYIIFRRKSQKKSVIAIQWFIASLTTLFAIYARISYVMHYDWEYAAGGVHIAAVTLVSIISLQYFYNRKLYLFFFSIYIAAYSVFLYMYYTVGKAPVITQGHLNGQIYHGINALSQIYFYLMTTIVAFLAYKTIPTVEEFDKMSCEQMKKIEDQSAQQTALSNEVKDKMNDLFPQIEKQKKVADDFHDRIQAQAASFEQISATLEELLGSSENISGTAIRQVEESGKMEHMIDQFRGIKETTKVKLNESLAQIKVIVSESGKGKEKLGVVENTISDISTQSNSISNMINIITDIADRINLLSLNASIEAARAGDQGRGFAVVADEIGKLASQTTDSIKQIEGMLVSSAKTTATGVTIIRDTSEIVRTMIESMSSSADKIGELKDSIRKEEQYIEDIYGQMKRTAELATSTEAGTNEQKIALQSTVKVIEHLNTLVSELVAGVEQLMLSSSHISESACILLEKTEKAAH
jgi:methyl-accepting chemotaxis protein